MADQTALRVTTARPNNSGRAPAWLGSCAAIVMIAAMSMMVTACGSASVVADAGSDFAVEMGEAPTFDGCGSSGDSLTYEWKIVSAPSDMVDDVGKLLRESSTECSFALESTMVVADTGDWSIELTVTDGSTVSTDRVNVTVN